MKPKTINGVPAERITPVKTRIVKLYFINTATGKIHEMQIPTKFRYHVKEIRELVTNLKTVYKDSEFLKATLTTEELIDIGM